MCCQLRPRRRVCGRGELYVCREAREAGEAVRAQAVRLRPECVPAENRRAQQDTAQALQHLAEAVERLRSAG